jgi:hypothetical protein
MRLIALFVAFAVSLRAGSDTSAHGFFVKGESDEP